MIAENLKDELFAWVSRYMDEADNSLQEPRIVVETLAVYAGTDILEQFRQQGAPPEVIEDARQLFEGLPERVLVVRVRNEGMTTVRFSGYGVLASRKGTRTFRKFPYAPTTEAAQAFDFEPGDYHEFVINVSDLAHELQNPILQFRGKATLRGFYQGYDGSEYVSDPVLLDLPTLDLEWSK